MSNHKFEGVPILVVGMHRSGTSMVTKILSECGVFMGCDVDDNSESLYFLHRNEKLFQSCAARWDAPEQLKNMYKNEALVQRLTGVLTQDLLSLASSQYRGRKPVSVFNGNCGAWGWKDPRMCYLLPLWARLFKNVRVVHIVRNGVDVARSLQVREAQRVNTMLGNKTVAGKMAEYTSHCKNEPPLVWLVRRLRALRSRLSPLHKYEHVAPNPCIDIEYAFSLWENYSKTINAYLKSESLNSITIKYEDFLSEPSIHLQRILDHCEVSVEPHKKEAALLPINKSRSNAFLNDGVTDTIKKMFASDVMKQYGYHY